MTPKQIERTQNKIKQIKRTLAADKKEWGGFHRDGQGLRYLPPSLYLKLHDYTGAQRYFNWFHKNFPEDSCFPVFLFEWTITLFKKKKINLAEKKAMQTFGSNTYLIDFFLGHEPQHLNKFEDSNWKYESLKEHFNYSKDIPELNDFTEWLKEFATTDTFNDFVNQYINIEIQLEDEPVGEKRSQLVNDRYQLIENLK